MSVLVGICGGSGSGKSTLADRIVGELQRRDGPGAASVLSFDSYYHDLFDRSVEERAVVNFDHPDALDHELLALHLAELRAGRSVAVPVYDFSTHCRSGDLRIVEASPVVVVEGILLFAFDDIRPMFDLRVFRRCPESVRFSRRIKRDIVERGRSLEGIEAQLTATVKPMHDQYVEPYATEADLVTEHGDDLGAMSDRVVASVEDLLGLSR